MPLEERIRPRDLLALYAVLTVARAPWLFVAPRYFAEEGVIYLRYALDHGFWDALFAPHLGYYALVPNLATALAAKLPMPLAPFATLLVAFVVQLLPAYVLVHDTTLWPTRRAKLLGLLVLTLPLAMRREWLSTIHAQFWLALALCLMLVVAPRTRAASALYAVGTIVAACTGAVSAALAPVFLLVGATRRDPRLLLTSLVLGVSALAQSRSVVEARSVSWDPRELIGVALGKLFVTPFVGKLGAPLTGALFDASHHALLFVVLVLTSAAVIVALLRALDRDGRVLFLAATYLGVLGLVAALGPRADLADPLHGIRYVFVPHVVYGLLLARGAERHPARVVALAAMLIVGAIGAASAARFADAGLAYRRDVTAHRTDAGRTLTLHIEACRIAPDARRAREGFDVRTDDTRARFEIDVARLDRHADTEAFVIARSGEDGRTLTAFDGTRFVTVTAHFIGDVPMSEPGACALFEDGVHLPAAARARTRSHTITIPRERLRALPPESSLFVGYGRDLADALAKGTFVEQDLALLSRD